MRLSIISIIALFTLCTAACGDAAGPLSDHEISVTDHVDALTTGAGDNLFVLTLDKAPEGMPLTTITVTAGLPGQTDTAMRFDHDDTNSDGKLNVGEKLTCREPPVNIFDDTTAGRQVNIGLAENRNGTLYQVATAIWTVTN